MAKFKNPANGYVEEGGGSGAWLWALLFGPLYFALKGAWAHAVIYVVIIIALLGVAALIPFVWLAYALVASSIVEKQYLRRGWVKVAES